MLHLLYSITLMQILCACLLRCSVLNVTVFLLQFSTTHCSCLSVCAECFSPYCSMYIVSNTCRVVNVMRKLHFKMSVNNRHFKTSLLGYSLFHLTYNSLLYLTCVVVLTGMYPILGQAWYCNKCNKPTSLCL